LKKIEKKSDSLFNSLDIVFESIEGLMFGIPYLIMTSIGTLVKVFFLSLISLVTFNQLIKLKKLWTKQYVRSNIVNPWNCVVTIVFLIALFNLV